MMTVRGYRIPKYLYKRKIEIIKRKIIKRKYGYLFYRKTISQVLPSQARRYYTKNLIKKAFFAWVMIWYEERKMWKLMVKAQIHYSFNVMQKMLDRWKEHHSKKIIVKLKWKIAEIHFQKIRKRQIILLAFNKWRLYQRYKIYRKVQYKIALTFFKSKYNRNQLKIFINRWVIFTRASKREKTRFRRATMQHHYKLKLTCFRKLLVYKDMRNKNKKLINNVLLASQIKLQRKTLTAWKNFINIKKHKKQNLMLSEAHYVFRLKYIFFKRLLFNKIRNKTIKQKISAFKNYQNQNILRSYFLKLMAYKNYRLLKHEKQEKSNFHYNKTLTKKIFVLWKKYELKKQCKKKILEKQILNAKIYIECAKKRFLFKKWKQFWTLQLIKRQKLLSAKKCSINIIVRKYFYIWMLFLKNQRKTVLNTKISIEFYQIKILKMTLAAWKTFTYNNKNFKQKLKEADCYYKTQLKKEALHFIIKSGLIQKELNFKENKQRIDHQLFLSHKYFSIWKQRTIYKKDKYTKNKLYNLADNKENMVEAANVDWYPICFLAPRTFKL